MVWGGASVDIGLAGSGAGSKLTKVCTCLSIRRLLRGFVFMYFGYLIKVWQNGPAYLSFASLLASLLAVDV